MESFKLPIFFKSIILINLTEEDVCLFLCYDQWNRIIVRKRAVVYICFCNVDLLTIITERKGHLSKTSITLLENFSITQIIRNFSVQLIDFSEGRVSFIISHRVIKQYEWDFYRSFVKFPLEHLITRFKRRLNNLLKHLQLHCERKSIRISINESELEYCPSTHRFKVRETYKFQILTCINRCVSRPLPKPNSRIVRTEDFDA